MSSLIVFRRVAKRELDDAISWYEGRREGLGQEFSLAVEKQLARIASDPDHFAPVKGSIRRSILRRDSHIQYSSWLRIPESWS